MFGWSHILQHTQLLTNRLLAFRGVYPAELLDGNCRECPGLSRLMNNSKTATPNWTSNYFFVWDVNVRFVQFDVEGICDGSQIFRPISGQASE
jgi:hypothetical protein